jgi:hypothetical protein
VYQDSTVGFNVVAPDSATRLKGSFIFNKDISYITQIIQKEVSKTQVTLTGVVLEASTPIFLSEGCGSNTRTLLFIALTMALHQCS